jgi:hypothetical protein
MSGALRLTANEAETFPVLLRTVAGSEVHGIGLPGLGDIDHIGVAVDARDNVLGMGSSPEGWTYRTAWDRAGVEGSNPLSEAGDLDLTIYPACKFARLALKGNPSALTPLFVDDEFIVEMDDFGADLRENRQRFISNALGRHTLGYAVAQRERLLGLRSNTVSRPELVEQHGYDVKFAAHMLRLGHQALGVFKERTLQVPLPAEVAASILAVRRGERSLADVLAEAVSLEATITHELEVSTLPEYGDSRWVNRWLARAHTGTWNDRASYPTVRPLPSGVEQARVPAGVSSHGGEFAPKGQSLPEVRL